MNQKKDAFRQFAFKFLIIAALSFSFAALSSAQTTDEDAKVTVPETVMREVVRRILVYSFKPRNKRTVIRLYERGIRREWLPEIKNIEFQLVPEVEIEKSGAIYFFQEPDLSEGKYKIGFGFGDPNCEATGTGWAFRLVKQKVRLWLGEGFGTGCGIAEDYGPPS